MTDKERMYLVGYSDYLMAKNALDDVMTQTPSATRIFATTMMGSRAQWAAVVELFEDSAVQLSCNVGDIEMIEIFMDGSAQATIGTGNTDTEVAH